jgi:hypothetical protein
VAAGAFIAWHLAQPSHLTSELRNALTGGDTLPRQRILHLLLYWARDIAPGITIKQKWIIISLFSFGVLVLAALAPRTSVLRQDRRWSTFRSPLVFSILMVAFVLSTRLPLLAQTMMNPDEGQFITSAATLERDPVFFRATATGTAGPLVSYFLLLPKAFGLPLDYATARMVGLLLFCSGLLLCYRALAACVPEYSARVAMLPTVFMVAILAEPNYVHYSSEQVPVFLYCASFYLFVRYLRSEDSRNERILITLGVLVPLGFFAKMQVVPLLAGICALTATVASWKSDNPMRAAIRSILLMGTGCSAATALILLVIYLNGVWSIFVSEYLLGNLTYVSNAVQRTDIFRFVRIGAEVRPFIIFSVGLGTAYLACLLFHRRRQVDLFRPLQAALTAAGVLIFVSFVNSAIGHWDGLVTGLWVLLAISTGIIIIRTVLVARREKQKLSPELWIAVAAVVSVLCAAYAVVKPGRGYLHYFNLMIVPIGLVYASLYLHCVHDAAASLKSRYLEAAFLFLSVICVHTNSLNGIGGTHVVLDRLDRIPLVLGDATAKSIVGLTRPGEPMTVWGWEPELYCETALLPATRHAVVSFTRGSDDGPLYRYARDLEISSPTVFVDAVGQGRFHPGGMLLVNHEVSRTLATLIDTKYRLTSATDGYRVYLKNSRLVETP